MKQPSKHQTKIDARKLELEISQQHEAQQFSGVIMIREKGKMLFGQGYGFANRAESIPNTLKTRYEIASGGKSFTAVAICQLVEKGLITFETRLVDCLDVKFPAFDPAVTVHHLLTHCSGIPDYFDEEVMDDFAALWKDRPMYQIRKPRDFLPMFQDQKMKFAPGTKFSYSNSGYIVLGLIVEQAAGMDFPEYVENNIFEPCGMINSGYFETDRLPARTAHGYIPDGEGGWRTNIFAVPIIGGPDGGVYVTALDVASFWDALLGHRILSKQSVETMLTPHQLTGRKMEAYGAYGYGMWIGKPDGTSPGFSMVGEDPGAAFFAGWTPGRDRLVTVIGNMVAPVWPMVKRVREVLEESL